jgi:hypothetical protein
MDNELEDDKVVSGFHPIEEVSQDDAVEQTPEPVEHQTAEPTKMEVKLDRETIDLIRSTGQEVPSQKKNESDNAYYQRVLDLVQPYSVDNETAKFLLRMQDDDEVDPQTIERLQQFVNKIVRNASGLARYQVEQRLAEMQQHLQPIAQNYAQEQHQKVAQEFLGKYSYLEKYTPLVQLSISQLQAEGFTGEPAKAYDAVAKRAEQLATQMGIVLDKGQLSQRPSNPNAPISKVPTMASLGGGGRTASGYNQQGASGQQEFVDPWRRKTM